MKENNFGKMNNFSELEKKELFAKDYLYYILRRVDDEEFKDEKEILNKVKLNMLSSIRTIEARKMGVLPESINMSISLEDLPYGKDSMFEVRSHKKYNESGVLASIQFSKSAIEDKSILSLGFEAFRAMHALTLQLLGGKAVEEKPLRRGELSVEEARLLADADKNSYMAEVYAYNRLIELIDEAVETEERVGNFDANTTFAKNRKASLKKLRSERTADFRKANAKLFINNAQNELVCAIDRIGMDYVVDLSEVGLENASYSEYIRNAFNEERGFRNYSESKRYINKAKTKKTLSMRQRFRYVDSFLVALAEKLRLAPARLGLEVVEEDGFDFDFENHSKELHGKYLGTLKVGNEIMQIENTEEFLFAVEQLFSELLENEDFKNAVAFNRPLARPRRIINIEEYQG